jgi:cytoskeletal protein CcmA (bactofilin family)
MGITSLLSWGRRRRSLDRAGAFSNALGPGLHFHGTLAGRDNSIVFGRVTGRAELDGSLVLAPGSVWEGDIAADIVIIAGEVAGNVSARRKIELTATARVSGDLVSPSIAIAKGAAYDGRIHAPRKTRKLYFEDRRARLVGLALVGADA